MYQFQEGSIMVRQSCTLQSVPPNISSTHLALYIVITVVLTLFPLLYFTSLWLFCNCQFVLFNPFILKIEHFSTHALAPPPPKKRKRKEDNSRKKGHSYLKKKKLHSCTDIPIVLIFFFWQRIWKHFGLASVWGPDLRTAARLRLVTTSSTRSRTWPRPGPTWAREKNLLPPPGVPSCLLGPHSAPRWQLFGHCFHDMHIPANHPYYYLFSVCSKSTFFSSKINLFQRKT